MGYIRDKFSQISAGHILIVICILFTLIVYLLDGRVTRLQNADRKDHELTLKNESRLNDYDWFRNQGVDFSKARKYNIKPPSPSPSPNESPSS
jgi:hypothetical protein